MNWTTFVPCRPSSRHSVVFRTMFLACFVALLLMTSGMSAQTTQTYNTTGSKTNKKAKATPASKSNTVASAKKDRKLAPHPQRFPNKQQAETGLDEASEKNAK